MYRIELDRSRNRIYVTFIGMMTLDEVETYNEEFKRSIDQAKPGFTVLLDATAGKPFLPQVNERVAASRRYAMTKGLSNTATVVSTLLLKVQADRTLEEVGSQTFSSRKEADQYLDVALPFATDEEGATQKKTAP